MCLTYNTHVRPYAYTHTKGRISSRAKAGNCCGAPRGAGGGAQTLQVHCVLINSKSVGKCAQLQHNMN